MDRPLTIDQAFQIARQHHQGGRLQQAEQLYRQILAKQPDYAAARNNLGNVLKQNGRIDEAIAECRAAIALQSDFPEAHYNLANALQARGELDAAIASFRHATALRPGYFQAHGNLGLALRARGRLDEAIASYRRAVELNPAFAEAYNNLGTALKEKGWIDESIAACRQAISLKPNFPEAHNNLGNALRAKRQLDEAIAEYQRAIALRPGYFEACYNLGTSLGESGKFDEAIATLREASSLNPRVAEAHNNLGNFLKTTRQFEAAIASYRRAIALRAGYADAYSNLGLVLELQGHADEAIAAHRQAIAVNPKLHEAYSNLGNALKNRGELDEAIAAYRQAIALEPGSSQAHSNLVYTLQFHPGQDAASLAEENERWNRQHARSLEGTMRPHGNDRNPNRRLRIGYVSPDFRDHPVGRFLLPLLANHDKSEVEIIAYSQVSVPDEMTQRLFAHTDGWRNIIGTPDADVAELIQKDRIDILVDLTMHMADNRLLVFARKPAPIQLTYLAYCSSTGLGAIDYRLSDPYLDPPGGDESVYSERTIRLPETYWCYQPSVAVRGVGPVPAIERGGITFGGLNNFCKVSEPALATWAKLLRAVPNSRLVLHAHDGSHRRRVQELLKRDGIETDRLEFVGFVATEKYFDLYAQIDIALDTFPYAGGTTTCDALWMGVPVVTLAGRTAVGRGGVSILSNMRMPELVAHSEDEYAGLASALANDLPRLSNLRSTLRRRMEQSPLMDAPKFARNIEAGYRQMWQMWCRDIHV